MNRLLQQLGLKCIISASLLNSPVLAGPLIQVTEAAVKRCLAVPAKSVCKEADDAAISLQFASIGKGNINEECLKDSLDLMNAIASLTLAAGHGGNIVTAKAEVYKIMAGVKRNCRQL